MIAHRVATRADAERIAMLHLASWRVAYRGLVPDLYLDSLTLEEQTGTWRPKLESRDTTVLLAEDDGTLAGFCAVGPSGDEDADSSVWLIANLHVAPERRGQGIGGPLFDAAVDIARDSGARTLTLWVIDGNWPARRFYEKKGMRPDGARRVRPHPPGVDVTLLRYRCHMRS
jgi:GNAT superfamily N-acetyltransferase